MRRLLLPLLPLLFFTVAYILPLDARSLLRPDETRYAEIPREMITSGHWVTPKLAGARYFEKPPLGYWLIAFSEQYFGESKFAVRLPSAVGTGATAVVLFLLSFTALRKSRRVPAAEKLRSAERRRRKRAEPQPEQAEGTESEQPDATVSMLTLSPLVTASLAALIYLSCCGVFAVGTTAVLDGIFTFHVTAIFASFYAASELRRGSPGEWLLLASAGLFCAAAFLTKGFLAVVLPIIVLVPWLLWQRRFADILRMSWLPLLVAFFVVLPWVLQINWWEKDFWRFFIVNEHLRRFMGGDAQHAEPFWFFFFKAPVLLFPWLMMVPAAVAGLLLRREDGGGDITSGEGRLLCFCFFWAVLPFLFFSLSSGKLLTYILPCLPPVALLIAVGLGRLFALREGRGLFAMGTVLTALVALVALALLIYVQIFGVEGLRRVTGVPGGTPLYADNVKAAIAGGGLLVLLLFLQRARFGPAAGSGIVRLSAFGLAPLLLYAVSPWMIPDQMVEKRMPGPLLERYADRISADDIIVSGDSCLRAVCWYWKRTDVHAVEWAGELTYGFRFAVSIKRGGKISCQNRFLSRQAALRGLQ